MDFISFSRAKIFTPGQLNCVQTTGKIPQQADIGRVMEKRLQLGQRPIRLCSDFLRRKQHPVNNAFEEMPFEDVRGYCSRCPLLSMSCGEVSRLGAEVRVVEPRRVVRSSLNPGI